MLNRIRPAVSKVVTPIGKVLAKTGVTPNVITVTGTVGVAGGALVFYPQGVFFWGTVFITAFVLFDMFDGAVARITGKTGVWGAFLDSTMDRVADAAIFAGLIMYFSGDDDTNLLLAWLALYCLVSGVVISYAKARAEGLGMECNVGIAERPERLILSLVGAGLYEIVPYVLHTGLIILAVLSTITVGQRFAVVYKQASVHQVEQ